MKKQGLHYKLIKAFLLQILLISFATLLGVFTTEIIVEKVLVRQALVGEAAHFWARHREDPDFPKPETLNLKGYLAIGNNFTGIPVPLRKLDPGYYRTDFRGRKPIIYVEDRGNMRLYLVFEEQQIAL